MSNHYDDDGFGAPVHQQERKAFPEGPKKGENIHRVLPPILNQRESGKYVMSHTCHYGYGLKREGSDKEFPNPFYCVEEGNWVNGRFVVTQDCPECQAIKFVKTQKEAIAAKMKSEGKSDSEVAQATASHDKWLRKHNRDFKQYVNVKDVSGRFFTAKYPQKEVWKKIKGIIEDWKSRAIPVDPIAANQGFWFRIVRTGEGFKTEYTVDIVQEEVVVNGQVIQGAMQPKRAALTSEDAKKAKETCMDLADVGIKRLTLDQVKRLVASKGDPKVVEAIFAASTKVEKRVESAPVEESPLPADEPEEKPVEVPVQTQPAAARTVEVDPSPVVTSPPKTSESPEDLLAQAKALMERAKKAQAATEPLAKVEVKPEPKVEVKAAPAPGPAPVPAPKTEPKVQPAPAGDLAEAGFFDQFTFDSTNS